MEQRNFRNRSMDYWIQLHDTQIQSQRNFKIKKRSGKYCKSALKRGLIILTFFISFSGTNLPSGSTWNGGIFPMDRWIQLHDTQTQSPLAFKIKKRSGKYCKSALKRGLIILTLFISFSGTNLSSGSTWNGVILAMDRWIQLHDTQTQPPINF